MASNCEGEMQVALCSRKWLHPVLVTWVTLMSSVAMADALPLSFEWDWAVSYETASQRDSAFIQAESARRKALNSMLDVQINYNNFSGLFTLSSQGWYQSGNNQHSGWHAPQHDWLVRELVWQGEWQLGATTLDVSAGKLRVDWGVGYGYRPLDLFKPYRQNPLGLVAEEGAGVVSLSYFDPLGDWTLIATDSGWGQQAQSTLDQAAEQRGIGLRRYMLSDDSEYQAIAYYDDLRRGLVGASVISLWDASLAWHGSALWQKQSVGYAMSDSVYVPVEVAPQGDAFQALLGLNWANPAGHNIIAEYWYDSRAWSKSEWQQAIGRGEWLSFAPQTAPLAASYAQGLQHANIVQHNLLVHWSWDSEAWLAWQAVTFPQWLGDWTPTLDVMIAPQDGGMIATQWLNYQWIDTGEQSVELEFAARFLIGDDDSAYAQINDKHMIVFNLRGKF